MPPSSVQAGRVPTGQGPLTSLEQVTLKMKVIASTPVLLKKIKPDNGCKGLPAARSTK